MLDIGRIWEKLYKEEIGGWSTNVDHVHEWCKIDSPEPAKLPVYKLIEGESESKLVLNTICRTCFCSLEVNLCEDSWEKNTESAKEALKDLKNTSDVYEIEKKLLEKYGKCYKSLYGHHWHIKHEETEQNSMETEDKKSDTKTLVCCECNYSLEFRLKEPVIPATTLAQLKSSKIKLVANNSSGVSEAKKQELGMEKYVSTINGILVLLRNAYKGDTRVIRKDSEKARERLGFDGVFTAIVCLLGFSVDDNFYYPPAVTNNNTEETKRKIELGVNQLLLAIYSVYEGKNSNVTGVSQDPLMISGNGGTVISILLGSNAFPLRPGAKIDTFDVGLRPFSPSYAQLGVPPFVVDRVIVWIYEKLAGEDSANIPFYLDSLTDLGIGRKSELLSGKVREEGAKGNYSMHGVKLAYGHFGTTDQEVSDELIIQLFDFAVSERPNLMATHVEKLGILAISRKSEMLLSKLEEISANRGEFGFAGIENIGNTCYLNSVLQYYYSIESLRELVLKFGDRETWNEELELGRKEGNRGLEREEIEKGVYFVGELHKLFGEMGKINEEKDKRRQYVRPSVGLAKAVLEPLDFSVRANEEKEKKVYFMPQQDITECLSLAETYFDCATPPEINAENTKQVIQRLFDGTLELCYTLKNKTALVKKETFNRIIVDLKDSPQETNSTTKCLERFFEGQQVEWVDEEGKREMAVKKTAIEEVPEYLQIQIQRTQFDVERGETYKSSVGITVEEKVSVGRFIKSGEEAEYTLYAVMEHEGGAEYGHYWIYIRNSETGEWWKYNDLEVRKASAGEVVDFGGSGRVYCMVYRRG
ncbi:hypothetical protein BB558_000829 [Smittium angustum]|uniref:Ubiquitin carboxyl-terminal hydrolase n=1 Tax=Smittium angustum TaxID=133377 RepID=A0A2U1JDG2_SMIAN|nr:hypothetical protein BB558_000829 [Smittium angustum]